MEQIVICNNCNSKIPIYYPNHIVWNNGEVECKCGIITKFNNDRIESLYI